MADTKTQNKTSDPRIPELDAILSDITNQKNKLEQLTKKMSTMPSKTVSIQILMPLLNMTNLARKRKRQI